MRTCALSLPGTLLCCTRGSNEDVFFDVRSGDVVLRDEEGVLAASPQEAIAQARAAARDMAAQHFLSRRFLDPVVIE